MQSLKMMITRSFYTTIHGKILIISCEVFYKVRYKIVYPEKYHIKRAEENLPIF